ncbi:BMP family ABC transporter substrate-binding protein [Agromyces protaetiae]|uniref:BMP family ABC transporter substrate-binding protein n=1 Tax=Agromyces protaetiae TaxID=2509455 RepID=A0A4P6FEL5_9MICO|nr:BMP family ABC transporter substrate-binding protein [Agromyces protaetiae]QAY74622.1 BMP family ABC transporter substrate-binding protein [Agromyces protaetiae]
MLRARRILAIGAVVAASVALTACQAAPEPGDGGDVAADECVRMVTNSGGLEDRSFNQSTWEGLQQAEDEFGVTARALVSTGETDLVPNVEQAAASGCSLVVTVGWELAEATTAQAAAHPELAFAIVDETVDAPNVKPVVFDTAQASFLAGYLAAGVSKTGVVATFGGGNQPPVTLFMDGFVDGVAAYNEAHGTSVRALGWNKEAQDGSFTGDFEDVNKGRVLTDGFIDQGADVILPVAGQVGEGAAAAAVGRAGVSIIWVDSDGFETLSAEFRPILLTSVLKNTQQAMVEIVGDVLDGSFTNEPYVGTLENGGVEIAPFHDLASLVSPELEGEIEGLRQRIIAGDLVVESPSSP